MANENIDYDLLSLMDQQENVPMSPMDQMVQQEQQNVPINVADTIVNTGVPEPQTFRTDLPISEQQKMEENLAQQNMLDNISNIQNAQTTDVGASGIGQKSVLAQNQQKTMNEAELENQKEKDSAYKTEGEVPKRPLVSDKKLSETQTDLIASDKSETLVGQTILDAYARGEDPLLVRKSDEAAKQALEEKQKNNQVDILASYNQKLTEMGFTPELIAQNLKTIQDSRKTLEEYDKKFNDLWTQNQQAIAGKGEFQPKEFWSTKDAGQKILVGLSIALDAVGSAMAGTKPQAWKVISNAITDYANEQAKTREQKLAAINQGLKLVENKMNTYSNAVKNSQNFISLYNTVKAGQDKVNAEYAKQIARRASVIDEAKFGLNKVDYLLKDPKEKSSYFAAPNGRFFNLGSQTAVNALQKEYSNSASVIENLNKLQGTIEEGGWQKFIYGTEAKGTVDLMKQSMIGKLREAILGPGVINDKERAIMENIIADPGKIFTTTTGAEWAKAEALKSMVRSAHRNQLKITGVPTKLTQNEKNIELILKRDKKSGSVQNVISAIEEVKRLGKWNDNETLDSVYLDPTKQR